MPRWKSSLRTGSNRKFEEEKYMSKSPSILKKKRMVIISSLTLFSFQ